MWTSIDEPTASWAPSHLVKAGRVADFPAGSLLLYPRTGSAGGAFELAVRVGDGSLVFCLTAMAGGAASPGDLIDAGGWRAAILGIDAAEHGQPVLEFDLSAGFAPEPSYDDRRGGFLCLGHQGPQLRARANAFVGRIGDEALIDPLTWRETAAPPAHDRPTWIANWRLRIPIGGDGVLVFDGGVEQD